MNITTSKLDGTTTSRQATDRDTEYVVRIDQGDYLQLRGGNDWGRADQYAATRFDGRDQAEATVARLGIQSWVREYQEV
jgi:hypothetical protein